MSVRPAPRPNGRVALLALLVVVLAAPARADPPAGAGNTGAYQRANLSAAGPGSVNAEFDPIREEPGRFSLQWIFPFVCASSNLPAPYLTLCSTDADIDASEAIAPVYTMPDGAPDPGDVSYWGWFWPLMPQLAFGEPSSFYEAQLGVVVKSIGHGTLIRNYTNSPNTTYRRPGLVAELKTPGVVGEVIVGDVLSPLTMLGARLEFRPLSLLYGGDVRAQPAEFDHDAIAAPYTRWKTGFTLAADMYAPFQKTDDAYQFARGPFDPTATVPQDVRGLVAMGFDNAFVLVERETSEALMYADINALSTPFQPFGDGRRFGLGGHVGGRFQARAGDLQLRVELEANVAGPGYVPGYFDQMYTVERQRLVGNNVSKLFVDAPLSAGYLYRLALSYLPYVSVFVEGVDQVPLDLANCQATTATCGNNGRVRVGLSGSFLMFDGTLSASQSGVQNYLLDVVRAEGLTLLAEGRMTLFFRYVQLLSRLYVVQDPVRGGPTAGGFLGLEVNLSL